MLVAAAFSKSAAGLKVKGLPRIFLTFVLACSALATHAIAQNLEDTQILNPGRIRGPSIMAITQAGGMSNSRRSRRRTWAISTLAWVYPDQPDSADQIVASARGWRSVLHGPDNIWAVDARSGHMVWHYHRPSTKGDHIGHRGVAMYKGWLYFTTPDCHLISLDAKDGKVRWDKVDRRCEKGYWTTMAPLVVQGMSLQACRATSTISPAICAPLIRDRRNQWQWDATPPAGTPNGDDRRHDMDDRYLRS